MPRLLRPLAHLAALLALAALGLALGRWLRDPNSPAFYGFVIVAVAVWFALRHLYGRGGVADLRRPAPVVVEPVVEPEAEPEPVPLWADPRVDLNSAGLEELQTLPGIGPVAAARITAARPFDAVEDLVRVQGVGPAKVRALADLVRAGTTNVAR
jgi:competence protein ComEA